MRGETILAITKALKSAAEYHIGEIQDDASCEWSYQILLDIKAALDLLGVTVEHMDETLAKARQFQGQGDS